MSTLLVTTVLALGCGAQPAVGAGAHADGKWLIVYAEEGGRRNNAWEQRQAMLSKGTLTYEAADGKKRSLTLKFGAHQSIEATVSEDGGGGKMRRGVYILGQDYLCISLEKGKAGGAGAGATGATRAPAQPAAPGAQAGQSSGNFILILRRQRGGAKRE